MKLIIESGTLKKCLLEPGESRLDVPEGVTRIGKGALWQIELEVQQQGWPPYFFPQCEELQELTLPEGLTEIGLGAFMGCTSLKRVRFPKSLRSIGTLAFSFCNALEEIELPEGLLRIGSGAFSYCKLRRLSLPESLQRISRDAFHNCDFDYVRVPGPVKITTGAFSGFMTNRAELELGPLVELSRGLRDGLLEVEYSSFSPAKLRKPDPRYLLHGKNSTVPEGVTHIGEGAFRNRHYSSISLPEGLTSIAAHAFRGCDELKELVLPSTLKHLGDFAFAGCVKLRRLVIPEGLESVGSRAFNDIDQPLSDREMFDFSDYEPLGSNLPGLPAHLLPEGLRFIDGCPFDSVDKLDPVFIRHGLEEIAPYLHPKTLMRLFLYNTSDAVSRKLERALTRRPNFVDFDAISREIREELWRVYTFKLPMRTGDYYQTLLIYCSLDELARIADDFHWSFLANCSLDELVAHTELMREMGFKTDLWDIAKCEIDRLAREAKSSEEGET